GLWSDVGAGATMQWLQFRLSWGNNGYEFFTAIRLRCWCPEFQELSCTDRCML
ncbi:hypothetical protein MKX03_018516, partial [Papaver bracteatum]